MKRFRSSLAAAAALAVLPLAQPAHAVVVGEPVYDQASNATISLETLGSYDTNVIDKSAAEIVAYHAASKRLFTVNAQSGSIDVLDVADPANPVKLGAVNAGADTTINSVAVRPDGLAVAAVEPADKTEPGELIFFDAGADDFGNVLGRVTVGSLPDMVTITADGAWALVANEGEPAEDYSVDPEGSVGVVKLPEAVAAPAQSDVRTAGFDTFEGTLAAEGVHIFGQVGASTTKAQNLEPEYIATAGGKAYVTLQENNAVAVVDIASATVENVFPLKYIDRSKVPFDPSDKDGAASLTTLPVRAMLQPDSIAAHTVGGQTYLVMANEGDARLGRLQGRGPHQGLRRRRGRRRAAVRGLRRDDRGVDRRLAERREGRPPQGDHLPRAQRGKELLRRALHLRRTQLLRLHRGRRARLRLRRRLRENHR